MHYLIRHYPGQLYLESVMNKLQFAARQALEALVKCNHFHDYEDEITALREALAEQAEQEPVLWGDDKFAPHERPQKPKECADGCPPLQVCDHCQTAEQAEQEPVGYQIRVRPHGAKWLDWKDCSKSEYEKVFSKPSAKYHDYDARKLYAAPVQQIDLTDDEIMKINVDTASIVPTCDRQFHFARAVIAADREKNK